MVLIKVFKNHSKFENHPRLHLRHEETLFAKGPHGDGQHPATELGWRKPVVVSICFNIFQWDINYLNWLTGFVSISSTTGIIHSWMLRRTTQEMRWLRSFWSFSFSCYRLLSNLCSAPSLSNKLPFLPVPYCCLISPSAGSTCQAKNPRLPGAA